MWRMVGSMAIFGGSRLYIERSTLAYLPTLADGDLKATVPVEDWPDKRFTLDGLL
jgi:hypothetical protein